MEKTLFAQFKAEWIQQGKKTKKKNKKKNYAVNIGLKKKNLECQVL